MPSGARELYDELRRRRTAEQQLREERAALDTELQALPGLGAAGVAVIFEGGLRLLSAW